LENPPPANKVGAPERDYEGRLFQRLQGAYSKAHGGGEKPTRGWPPFLMACVEPLYDFGLPQRSVKAWQDALSKRRSNSGKKR
jgi:hypothetical protein